MALLLIFVVAATLVVPGRKVRDYPRVTLIDDADVFLLDNTSLNTNRSVAWPDIKKLTNGYAGTNYVNTLVTTTSNGLITIINNSSNNLLPVITNIANVASTNNVKVTAGTNIVVVTNVSGSVITYQVNDSINTNIFATTNYVLAKLGTNFINLSVQAAKLPTTNSPVIFAGFQTWELIYYMTNESGSIHNLESTWQFMIPPDYGTNSMKVKIQSIINATNGPGSSNYIFRASIFKATSGDSTDVHIGSFGAEVPGTNTVSASTSGTNKMQILTLDMSTNSLLQANDFCILKIVNDTNSTYRNSVSVIGLQLEYARP